MNKIVTTGWIDQSGRISEEKVPSLWIGERNIELGSSNNIDLILLYGYDKLEKQYLSSLNEVGYTVIDASIPFSRLCRKFSKLSRFGPYERNCFLRWPLIHEIYSGESIFHFDGDIVFNIAPEELSSRLNQSTFVLQGCPGITSISNVKWLEQYQKELNSFSDDVFRYSAQAWKERSGWEKSQWKKWSGERHREIISSDQDLISHLIHTDRLLQDDPAAITKKVPDILMFQNPLCIRNDLGISIESYQRAGNIDYINRKRVAFWHMQNDFTNFLRQLLLLKYILRLPGKIPSPCEKNCRLYGKLIQKSFLHLNPLVQYKISRKKICELFFKKFDFYYVFK
jgi:hypothetical protein